jgi:serine/threonine protein kinase
MISGLLEKDPTKRLTAEQMLEHEWMVNPATEVAYHDTEHVGFPFHQNRNSEIFIQIINKYASSPRDSAFALAACTTPPNLCLTSLHLRERLELSSTVVNWKRKNWRSSSKRPGILYRQAVRRNARPCTCYQPLLPPSRILISV